MANEQALERGSWLDRLHRWAFGERGHKGVLNQTACAAKAGDSPILTSHGSGPSHAHDPAEDAPKE